MYMVGIISNHTPVDNIKIIKNRVGKKYPGDIPLKVLIVYSDKIIPSIREDLCRDILSSYLADNKEIESLKEYKISMFVDMKTSVNVSEDLDGKELYGVRYFLVKEK